MKKTTRAALYERVSHEEAAKKGYSLEAQREDLIDYAKKKGYKIVDHYVDAGITARKNMNKRNEFQRLLDDVEAGKIDTIIFIKLDRWFRNISHYYKIQEILEENNVEWECSQEEFTTKTREGRLKINLFLMIAQDEADRTSERIKFVFDHKVKNGYAISGTQPFGYCVFTDDEGKKTVIKDKEVEEIVEHYIDTYELCCSKRKAMDETNEKFDVNFSYNTYQGIINKEQYIGSYRGNPNYCPPYMTAERQKHLQWIQANHSVKKNTQRTYVFSGLLICPKCGRKLAGNWYRSDRAKKDQLFYRCNLNKKDQQCTFSQLVSQLQVEKYLIANLKDEIEKHQVKAEIAAKNNNVIDVKKKRAKIQQEMDRLNNIYQKGNMTEEKYDREFADLKEKMEALEYIEQPKPINTDSIKELMEGDFEALYITLSQEEKQFLWRSVIEKIIIDSDRNITDIVFK